MVSFVQDTNFRKYFSYFLEGEVFTSVLQIGDGDREVEDFANLKIKPFRILVFGNSSREQPSKPGTTSSVSSPSIHLSTSNRIGDKIKGDPSGANSST